MREKLLLALACTLCPSAMASDSALTATKLFTAISAECSEKAQSNFVFSPYSMLGVFHSAQFGAQGETKKEMDGLVSPDEDFRLPSFDAPSEDGEQPVKVETANRIYADSSLEGNEHFESFDRTLRSSMGSDAKTIDFSHSSAAAAEINAFVEEKTRGHITQLIDPSMLSDDTKLVLVNALYFKAPWRSQFSPENTSEGVFYGRTGSGLEQQRVKFMRQRLENGFSYFRDSEVAAFSMNYADYRLRMYVFMPESLDAFESKIRREPEALEKLAASVKSAVSFEHELHLEFPKFRLAADSNKFNLVDLFRRLGARRMFDPREADFSGITGARGLYVSTYVHQADIDVGEEGTEATAATAMVAVPMSLTMPKTPINLRVEKPFLFQVRFEEEGSRSRVLFSGRIQDVSAAQ